MKRIFSAAFAVHCSTSAAQGQGSWGGAGGLIAGFIQLLLVGVVILAAAIWLIQRILAQPSPTDDEYAPNSKIRCGDRVLVMQLDPYEGTIVYVAATREVSGRHQQTMFADYKTGFVVESPSGDLHHFTTAAGKVKLLGREAHASAA